jgi:hypothetical protein
MATPATNNVWARGHIEPWWDLRHRELAYFNEGFNDPTSLSEWRGLGYTQKKFTGDMYDMRHPEPEWMSGFDQYFPLKNLSWCAYRMTPGCVLPTHGDTYIKFKEIYAVPSQAAVVRVIIFLEDWHSGHYMEMDGTPVINWRAGDWVSWHNDFPHLAANMGRTDRYTLQLTGWT